MPTNPPPPAVPDRDRLTPEREAARLTHQSWNPEPTGPITAQDLGMLRHTAEHALRIGQSSKQATELYRLADKIEAQQAELDALRAERDRLEPLLTLGKYVSAGMRKMDKGEINTEQFEEGLVDLVAASWVAAALPGGTE